MGSRRVALVMTVFAIAAILTGTRAGSALAGASAGKELAGHWCAECHALEAGKPSPNPAAPSFPELAANLAVTQYSLRLLLRSPHPTMPHIVLSDEQLEDIGDFILSLRPHD
jgi:mono/diheme cytochrome c family protein